MINPTRRGFLLGLLAAPVIVKASSIMAVKPVPLWTPREITFDNIPETVKSFITYGVVTVHGVDEHGNQKVEVFLVENMQLIARETTYPITGITIRQDTL